MSRRESVKSCRNSSANHEFKQQLLKTAIKAGRLYRQTRDTELQALIRKVEETL